jgi:hypothetical protein
MTLDMEPPEQRADEGPSSAPIGRRFALVLGLVVLIGAVVGTVIGSGILNLRDLGIGTGTGASPTAGANPSPSTMASTGSPTSSSRPIPAAGEWASVSAAADVRSDPSSDTVVDTVSAGQLVFVHSAATHNADGNWYDIEAAPDLRGWIDADSLNLDAVSGTIEWCAVPSKSVYELDSAQPFYKLGDQLILGDVPLQTRIFSLAALGTADLAWGDGTQEVCAELEIVDGAVSAATFHADVDVCGTPGAGAYGWGLEFGDAAVGPNGETNRRYLPLVADAVLGYSQMDAGRENPTEVAYLAGAGNNSAGLLACLHVTVSGGHDDTIIHTIVRADACAMLVSIGTETVEIQGIAPWYSGPFEFTLNPGSQIDASIVSGATLGMTIEADGGIDGAVRINPTPVSGCEGTAVS